MEPTSKKPWTIEINGRTYRVEVGDLNASPIEVMVDGERVLVEVDRGAPAPSETREPAAAGAPASAAATPTEIRSPMPGDIIEIQVQPGDRVRVGQPICYLEAMKMKSAIRSGRDGVIASVDVREGQSVSHGDVLVRFE
jgi:biotin carboxyl carrier protein